MLAVISSINFGLIHSLLAFCIPSQSDFSSVQTRVVQTVIYKRWNNICLHPVHRAPLQIGFLKDIFQLRLSDGNKLLSQQLYTQTLDHKETNSPSFSTGPPPKKHSSTCSESCWGWMPAWVHSLCVGGGGWGKGRQKPQKDIKDIKNRVFESTRITLVPHISGSLTAPSRAVN